MQLNRRHFVVSAAAGAFALGMKPPSVSAQDAATPGEVGVWAVVHPDDTVVIRIARSEMGQGTMTGLAQLVADEMDADWKYVRAEYVAPEENLARKRAWGDMSTGGSRGIRSSVEYVRKGGAAARAMLVQAAAQQWSVPVGECTAAASVITHGPTGRTLRYGEVAAAASRLPVPDNVGVKDPAQWTIIGKPVKRLDTVHKLNGHQVFAIDLQLPNMLNATIAQCPVFDGKLKSFDAEAIKAMPGVRYVLAVGDNAVAVVADKFIQAKLAIEKLPIVWDEGGNGGVTSASIAKALAEGLEAKQAGVGLKQGDVAGAFAGGGEDDRSELRHAVPKPRDARADERDGAGRRRPGRGVGADAEWRRLARGGRGGGWRGAGEGEGEQDQPGGRVRAPGAAGLYAAGGAAGQADPGAADQADLDPRRGYAARILPADHSVQADGQHGCAGHRDRDPYAAVGSVDPGVSVAGVDQGRYRSDHVPGHELRGIRLHGGAEPADRHGDAQHARGRSGSGGAST